MSALPVVSVAPSAGVVDFPRTVTPLMDPTVYRPSRKRQRVP
jgi:hypothetical protein